MFPDRTPGQPLEPRLSSRFSRDHRGFDHDDDVGDGDHTGECSLNANRKYLKVVDTLRAGW